MWETYCARKKSVLLLFLKMLDIGIVVTTQVVHARRLGLVICGSYPTNACFPSQFTRFVDTYSNLETPPRVVVHSLEKGTPAIGVVHEQNGKEILHSLGLTVPKIVTVKSQDGVTLYGAIYEPAGGKLSICSCFGVASILETGGVIEKKPALCGASGHHHMRMVQDQSVLPDDMCLWGSSGLEAATVV